MNLQSVAWLCRVFDDAGLPFWIDGGWGVDALLGKQTRSHGDLDLAVRYADLPAFGSLLAPHGFHRAERDGDPEWNHVLQNVRGLAVDLHGFVLDSSGNAVLGDPADEAMYPAGALDGHGIIGGEPVRCIAAPFVLAFRNAFTPRKVDWHDVELLCANFGLPVPSRYRER